MRLAVRCGVLLALVGLVSIEAASQRPIFGRTTWNPGDGTTPFVGTGDKTIRVELGLGFEGNVLLAFPESNMTITADRLTWGGRGWDRNTLSLDGNVRITINTDAKAVFQKIAN
jgi:hypothetical protein